MAESAIPLPLPEKFPVAGFFLFYALNQRASAGLCRFDQPVYICVQSVSGQGRRNILTQIAGQRAARRSQAARSTFL